MGTRSLSGTKITTKISGTLNNLVDSSVSSQINVPNLNFSLSLANGVSANQANRSWQSINRTLAEGVQETLDLYDMAGLDIGAGEGKDGLGQDVVFEEIVVIHIFNENVVTAAGQLEVVPASSEGWTPIGSHTVASGGALKGQSWLTKGCPAEDAFDINEASSHRITFRAVGGSVTYSIYLLARHDDDESSSSSSTSSSSSSVSSVSSTSSSSSSSSSSSVSSLSASSSSISTSSSSSSSESSSSISTSSSSSSTSSSSSSSTSSESSSSLSSQSA
jgi:hypothetical protein